MKKIFLILLITALNAFLVWAKDEGVPLPPPGAKQIDARTVTLGGQTAQGVFYDTQDSDKAVADYYRKNFTERNFKAVAEKSSVDKTGTVLEFSKGATLYSVIVNPQKAGTHFSVTAVTGAGSAEKLTFQELADLLPKEDVPGADLDIAARPPESIRTGIKTVGNTAFITYISEKNQKQLETFYREVMPDYGWQEDLSEVLGDRLDKAGRHAQRAREALQKSYITQDMNFMRLVESMLMMRFHGPKGEVVVSIMAADPGRPEGKAAVTIQYTEKREIYGKQ